MVVCDEYARAVGSGLNRDVVAAAGFASRRHALGMALQRLRADPSPAILAQVHTELERRLREAVRERQVRREGAHAGEAVRDALAWWLDPTCEACGGVRWRIRQQRLTGLDCQACSGSGVKRLAGEAQAWVVSRVESIVSASEDAHRRAAR